MRKETWTRTNDVDRMIRFLVARTAERKLRLIACAACRRVWRFMADERSQEAVVVAEKFADGLVSREQLVRAYDGAVAAFASEGGQSQSVSCAAAAAHHASFPGDIANSLERALGSAAGSRVSEAAEAVDRGEKVPSNFEKLVYLEERVRQADMIRDICGNLFDRIEMQESEIGILIRDLARTMYDSRNFDRMKELAEELAGGEAKASTLVNHLVSQKQHFRGCWALDVILGKES